MESSTLVITTQDNHVVNLDARVAQSSTLLGDMPSKDKSIPLAIDKDTLLTIANYL